MSPFFPVRRWSVQPATPFPAAVGASLRGTRSLVTDLDLPDYPASV
nr:hypothetical protein [Micromonospora acroterricola]